MNALYQQQFAVLGELDPFIGSLIEKHERHRTLWFSSDFLPANEGNSFQDEAALIALRERAKHLPDSIRVALDLNLRTEEGLPHFHRLVSTIAETHQSNLGRWNNLWTAEEDRHGGVLRDYIREARLFDFNKVERMQFEYVYSGFNPEWAGGSPYELLVYTTLQEKATQVSHMRTGATAEEHEPLLEKILAKVGEDEARHYAFYLSLYKGILERDPEAGLIAASRIMPSIDMPGVLMPYFKEYAEVVARLGIYGLEQYGKIVETVSRAWNIAGLTHVGPVGTEAQEKILALPARFAKITERIKGGMRKKTFSFEVIYRREFTLE